MRNADITASCGSQYNKGSSEFESFLNLNKKECPFWFFLTPDLCNFDVFLTTVQLQ